MSPQQARLVVICSRGRERQATPILEILERLESERQEQAARDRYLTDLAKREHHAWQRVNALIGTKRPGDYDGAVSLLVGLRDVNEQKGRAAEFAQRIGALREAHAMKPSLLARLSKNRL